jgi:hypothetical protein
MKLRSDWRGNYFGLPDQEVVERLPLNEDRLGHLWWLREVFRCTDLPSSAGWRSLARFYSRYQGPYKPKGNSLPPSRFRTLSFLM